jgi:hypothetical protein
MAVPLFHKVTPVISAELSPPPTATDKVRPVMVMVELLGFAKTICWTATLEAPGSWFELGGSLGPEAVIVTTVGVEEGEAVGVAVSISVFVGVEVVVEVRVSVGVALGVNVAVLAKVFVVVAVGV